MGLRKDPVDHGRCPPLLAFQGMSHFFSVSVYWGLESSGPRAGDWKRLGAKTMSALGFQGVRFRILGYLCLYL